MCFILAKLYWAAVSPLSSAGWCTTSDSDSGSWICLRGMEALLFTDFPLLFLHNERVSLRRARFRSMLFKA